MCIRDRLKASIAELRDYVGPNTILMPLMNGISASEELREAFPENTVLTAVVYVDARKIGNELFCGETFLIQIGDAEEAVLEAIKAVSYTHLDVYKRQPERGCPRNCGSRCLC